MRLGRVYRARPLAPLAQGATLATAGVIVLVAVSGAGAVAVGAALVACGFLRVAWQPQRPVSAPVTHRPPNHGQRERIVHERTAERHTERHVRERYWPFAA